MFLNNLIDKKVKGELCPQCGSQKIRICGFRSLGTVNKCMECCTEFIENMPLELDLLQASENALKAT